MYTTNVFMLQYAIQILRQSHAQLQIRLLHNQVYKTGQLLVWGSHTDSYSTYLLPNIAINIYCQLCLTFTLHIYKLVIPHGPGK